MAARELSTAISRQSSENLDFFWPSRGWIRCARDRSAGRLYQLGVQTSVLLDPETLPDTTRSDPLVLALDALGAAALAFGRRFARDDADPWTRINVLTRGRLLASFPAG